MLSTANPPQLRGSLCLLTCVFPALRNTCAVGSPAVDVVVRFPLLGDLVGVNEHDGHRHQADEGHQHRRAQSRVDVGDEAPGGGGAGREIRRGRRGVRFGVLTRDGGGREGQTAGPGVKARVSGRVSQTPGPRQRPARSSVFETEHFRFQARAATFQPKTTRLVSFMGDLSATQSYFSLLPKQIQKMIFLWETPSCDSVPFT